MRISKEERLERRKIVREMYSRHPELLEMLVEEGSITESSAAIVRAFAGEGKGLFDAIRSVKPVVGRVNPSEFYTPFVRFVEVLAQEPDARARLPTKYRGIKGSKRAEADLKDIDTRPSDLAKSRDWNSLFLVYYFGLFDGRMRFHRKKNAHALFREYTAVREFGKISVRESKRDHGTLHSRIFNSENLGVAHTSYLLKLLDSYRQNGKMPSGKVARTYVHADRILEEHYNGKFGGLKREWIPVFDRILESQTLQCVEGKSPLLKYALNEFHEVHIKRVEIMLPKDVPEFVPGAYKEIGVSSQDEVQSIGESKDISSEEALASIKKNCPEALAGLDDELVEDIIVLEKKRIASERGAEVKTKRNKKNPTFYTDSVPPELIKRIEAKPDTWMPCGDWLYSFSKEPGWNYRAIFRASNVSSEIKEMLATNTSLIFYFNCLTKFVSKVKSSGDLVPRWRRVLDGMFPMPGNLGWMLDLTPAANRNGNHSCGITLFQMVEESRKYMGQRRSTFHTIMDMGHIEYE